jgi:hypothetical protein
MQLLKMDKQQKKMDNTISIEDDKHQSLNLLHSFLESKAYGTRFYQSSPLLNPNRKPVKQASMRLKGIK